MAHNNYMQIYTQESNHKNINVALLLPKHESWFGILFNIAFPKATTDNVGP